MRFQASTFLAALLLSLTPSPLQASAIPRTVYQFPNTTWLENVFATRHGPLLTSVIGRPEVHLVDPFANSTAAVSRLLYSFPGLNAVFGLAELVPDTFAAVVGNYDSATSAAKNFSIWGIDLTRGTAAADARVSKIAEIPEGKLLNGMTSLNEHTLLIADSTAGVVLKLDTLTKRYNVAIDHPSMKIAANASLPLGINALKFNGGYLYYGNSFQNTLHRVRVSSNGSATGPFETITNALEVPDDLAVADDGTAFVASPFLNTVVRVELDGRITTVVGNLNSSAVAGVTGVTLGRTWRDRNVAYVSTNGGLSGPVNGTFVEGGKIVAFEIN